MPLPGWLLVCGGVLLCSIAAVAQDRPSLGVIAGERRQAAAPQNVSGSRFSTEQEWIVADIVTAIHQMTALAAGSSPTNTVRVRTLAAAPGAIARFEITVPGTAPAIVGITDHLWSPAAYVPLASSRPESTSHCAEDAASPGVAALLDPRASAILQENVRISARLQSGILCPDANEQAALLLGAFALREAAGGLSDPRRLMSRMTAHLAIANAAGSRPAGVTGRLADAVLLTLAGRQQSALNALGALELDYPDSRVQAWVRALRLRNTSDWRALTDIAHATLLEQLSLLRALETSVGEGPALDAYFRIEDPADTPDWGRIVLQADFGVEGGNRFSDAWLAAEIAEASAVLHAFDPGKALADREAVVRELNLEPANGPVQNDGTLQVVDRGTWAAAAQRHLLGAVLAKHSHYGNLGMPDEARVFRDDVARLFSGLQLYPIAVNAMGDRTEITRAFMNVSSLLLRRPDLVSDWAWRKVASSTRFAALQMPRDAGLWFVPVFPVGTTLDAQSRAHADGDKPRFTAAQLGDLRRIAPYSRPLMQEAIGWAGAKLSYDGLRKDLGPLAAYDVGFARTLAKAAWDRPDLYIPQMELVCRLSADTGYWELAPYLADHGRVEQARRAYETWLAGGRSEVAMSNAMDWLVRDYFERGEMEKAAEVADRVAEVYSFWGIVTRAYLHDWRGELDEAERDHRVAWRRYDNPNELLAFYLRHGRKGPDVNELMRHVFPTGLARVTPAATDPPPLDGVIVNFPGMTGMQQGLREKDIVTAVDGFRVRNYAQFRVMMGANADETVRFTLWRDGKYVEVPARLRYKWVVSTLRTYEPTPSTR